MVVMHVVAVSGQRSQFFTAGLDAGFLDHGPVAVAVVPGGHAAPGQG